MRERELLHRPEYVYPADPWRLVEKQFYAPLLSQAETLFAVANGYLGIRGSFEEDSPVFLDGTFINGFYESWPIVYGEDAHGFAEHGQTMLNTIDGKIIRLYVDDEPFDLATAEIREFERSLDMRRGTLQRRVLWETASGKRILVESERLVSLKHRHLAAITYQVTVLNSDAPLVLVSEMRNEDTHEQSKGDPRRPKGFRGRVLLPTACSVEDHRFLLAHQTKSSRMRLACGVDHRIETDCHWTSTAKCEGDAAMLTLSVDAEPGKPVRLTKFLAYHTSGAADTEDLTGRAGLTLDRALRQGYGELVESQRAFLDDFWRVADIELHGDPADQQAVRFNLFHLLQATARVEGAGVPAKGLTGQGYEGHYFWDTEIYVLPFLIYTMPRVAREVLRHRCAGLEKARGRARQVNQRGALFPWRTINGEEASAYYAAGTAQYHINADIVYAIKKYVEVTGDEAFLGECGAEVLVETARLWLDLGFFSDRKDGAFCIVGVTGPDEYNTVVNNNTYTNLMARENLWYAANTLERLRSTAPDRYREIADRTKLEDAEIDDWRRAADRMFLPRDEKLGIHLQDDSFLDRKPWDFASTPADKYPLLLHYHPLVIYRHRVIKQADVVLAMFLLSHQFTRDEKKANFDFYDPLTTGDSSLSASIQGIIAGELGYRNAAARYTKYAAMMDLGDIGRNVRDGCHIASMGGTWMAIVYGLAGLRDSDGRIRFTPRAPAKLDGVRFRLIVRRRLLEIDLGKDAVRYRLLEGKELSFLHDEKEVCLSEEHPEATRPLVPTD